MDQLGQVLAQVASQLGLAASALWPQLVAVTFYESLAWAVLDPLILAAMTWAAFRVAPWVIEHGGWDDDFNGAAVFVVVIGGACYLVLFALIVTGYPDVLAGVFAPQGMTAYRLLHELSGK